MNYEEAFRVLEGRVNELKIELDGQKSLVRLYMKEMDALRKQLLEAHGRCHQYAREKRQEARKAAVELPEFNKKS